jgi:hypothetical protein
MSNTCLSDIPELMDLINYDFSESKTLKLNKVSCRTTGNQKYKVIRYDKNMLSDYFVSSYGLCRSIIVNCDNRVVCFSPPKSISSERFIKQNPLKTDNIVAMEFVEGTMINVFWDPAIGVDGGWQIATRNTVGAVSSFYKNNESITFRDMFLEAAKENNLLIEGLNKECCYSFVLQHPKNRIVVPFTKPQLYLVGCYTIQSKSNNTIINVTSHFIKDVMMFKDWQTTTIKFPTIYEWTNYSELIEKYASMNTKYDVLGVVLYNITTGERAKIRNPIYEQVRMLRGNQPKLQYQYLCLRNEGKVSDFLNFYPENKKDFSQFRDQIHAYTTTLWENYVSCYIKKNKPLIEFSSQYRTHMFNLHKIYIEELKPQSKYITRGEVISYVNKLHPSLLMYCLNFHMRKRVVDFISADADLEY